MRVLLRNGRGCGRTDGAGGRRTAQGMTYVEVLVALAVLGVVMVGCYHVIASLTRLRQATRNHYLAVVIANNRIERAKAVSFSDLSLLAEDRVPIAMSGAPDPDGPFHRTTTVQTNYNNDARLACVTVTVEPPRLRRQDKQRPAESVSTLLTEYLEP